MLKKVAIGLGAVIGLLLVVGLLLPSKIHVERSATIAAPKSTVFATLTSLREFVKWSPWAKYDPTTTYTFSGPESGVGARMEWKSKEMGDGSQEIIAIDSDRRITVALDFGEMGKATAYYALEPVEAGTALTWGFDEDVGMNLMGRYVGLAMNHMVGGDYERGLASLKDMLEVPPPPAGQ
jgi:uncharacterized protein YndB with AHSA1/START domain